MKRLYLANYPRVQLDMRCQIFQTLTYQNKAVLKLMKDQEKTPVVEERQSRFPHCFQRRQSAL